MDIRGAIADGNYSRLALNMTGDVTVSGGNFLFSSIATNGFALLMEGANTRGMRVDGVKCDDFTLPACQPLEAAQAILTELLPGGRDAFDAWITAIAIIHTYQGPMTVEDFKAAYIEKFSGLTYSGAVLSAVSRATGLEGWDNLREFIAGKSLAQLTGEPTELVEVES